MEMLLMLLIKLIILGLIFYVLWWGLGRIALPEPFNKIAIAILVIFAVVALFYFLVGIAPLRLG